MSFLLDSVQAFSYIYRQQGLHEATKLTWRYIRTPFYSYFRGYVLRRNLSDPFEFPDLKYDLEFSEVTGENISILETIHPPLRVKRLANKIQVGEICMASILDGNVVAYVFAGFEKTPSTQDACLMIKSNEAYLWAGYALPDYRRQGIVGAVNLKLCLLLIERGYKEVVILVDRRNRPSLGHLEKLGYYISEKFTHLRILKWNYSSSEPVSTPTSLQTDHKS